MPNIELQFLQNLNTSVQVGDLVYSVSPTSSSNFQTSEILEDSYLGVINSIDNEDNIIVVTVEDGVTTPIANQSFIFFSKDNRANLSSLKGYYGLASFRNNSELTSELFGTAAEITESSK
tara:strand:- start:220 stop:579 length:360 start_codon:yes stop_codon:yes gene_type:complete